QQRKEIGNLQRDEKALARLIVRLERIIAAQRAKAPRAPAKGASRAPGTEREAAPEAFPSGAFAALKGRLRLPVRGTVSNRYGGKRQEGSTWKGLFIRAAQGSEVKAIAGGRVVFSDWMRGFGNLLIVDHGDSYLSIYGYNDAVLTQVGDEVRGGDPIATAGNSGGNPESGLYFELRHQGQPVDPQKWIGQ
ncbi:MAG: peptidoglycan DD-metalloendopeptidase family protein, partial [Candidatus Accumulibacter sp.]|nr:peptidoglycan DD-metalloendopeptidase family protein [Accumulibacter sp.]